MRDRFGPTAVVAILVGAAILLGTGPPVHGQRSAADRAEIRRDTFGVPHILAEDEEAAGFAFGYAMAEGHASEIGRRYLQARGEAAWHLGAGETDSDFATRRLDNRGKPRAAVLARSCRRAERSLIPRFRHHPSIPARAESQKLLRGRLWM